MLNSYKYTSLFCLVQGENLLHRLRFTIYDTSMFMVLLRLVDFSYDSFNVAFDQKIGTYTSVHFY